MYKFKNSLVAFTGMALVIGCVTALPRPTQGQGGNSGAAPPTFDVNVINTPLSVRDRDNPARQPFQRRVGVGNPLGVPAGKRLVIEHVSTLSSSSGICTLLVFEVLTTVAGVTEAHTFPTQFAGIDGHDVRYYSLSQQARLYADPQTTVELSIANSGAGDCGTRGEFVISGHLEDVP
jgi:hypothetical protein